MAKREDSALQSGPQRRRVARRMRKTALSGRLLIGPQPEPLWQRMTSDTRTVTEAVYTDVCPETWQILPTPRHFIVDLVVNSQSRESRVFHTKQEALTQGMAWYRQYESPFHRLAMRLHVPDAIAARGTLGVRLPRNGQGLVCELFAFHNGSAWQVLVNADTRPLLTREYRTEAAACLDAWGLAWKLQGHALPWPAHWLPTPPIVRKAMERYDRVPTVPLDAPAVADAGSSGRAGGSADARHEMVLPRDDDGRAATAGQARNGSSNGDGEAGAEAGVPASMGTTGVEAGADGEHAIKPFKLLHFAPPPHKIVRRRRPLREL